MTNSISSRKPSRLCGILIRQERWGLSRRGWVTTIIVLSAVLAGFIFNIHSFLAVTHPVKTNMLVVEGWVHDYGIKAAVKEYQSGHYDYIFATGGPMEGMGNSSSVDDTEAYRTADLLRKAGVPTNSLQQVASLFVGRDRTYNSAIALRDWFHNNKINVQSFNIVTEDAHARRTRLLFQEAFGGSVHIGIIAASNPDYDADHWWHYSEGVREVIDETVAYLYAKFLFWPGKTR